MTPRLLTIMGSGETSPTMVRVHRRLLEQLDSSVAGVVLDTPYAFQENTEEISQKAVEYFGTSLNRSFQVVRFRADGPALETEQALERLRRSSYVFCGPGSPTYALRHWKGSTIPDLLANKLVTGGALTFASAAALTLGEFTVPVYEIYKVGEDPHWVEGLDLLGDLGLRAAVIPHFDNAEGGTHDTRYSYLGERRLRVLEERLPDDAFILGVDEHTACLIDLESGLLEVEGRGQVTIRRRGEESRIDAGDRVPLEELIGLAVPKRDRPESVAPHKGRSEEVARAALEILTRLEDRAADMEDSGLWGQLRAMIVRLEEAAHPGLAETMLAPLVDTVLQAREAARQAGRWDEADQIRDDLEALGIEVQDTTRGTVWSVEKAGHHDLS